MDADAHLVASLEKALAATRPADHEPDVLRGTVNASADRYARLLARNVDRGR
jgi:hypothetical protein